jgi:hypothetical protein
MPFADREFDQFVFYAFTGVEGGISLLLGEPYCCRFKNRGHLKWQSFLAGHRLGEHIDGGVRIR